MKKKYILSFTVGSLFVHELVLVAKLYKQFSNWELVKKEIFEKNLLQTNKNSTSLRYYWLIKDRINMFTEVEADRFLTLSLHDQKIILWLAICRKYLLIKEFVLEVVYEKYRTMQPTLLKYDFVTFLNRKSVLNPELETISDSTRKKITSVVFQYLREVGILTIDNQITPILIGSSLHELIQSQDPEELKLIMQEPRG